ncbi:MAG: lysylphosphatidylglycerol synthase transmembrane domain-containing protein [Planctomycetota bacterium]
MKNPRAAVLSVLKVLIPLGIIVYLLLTHVTPSQWQTLATHPKNYPLLCVALLVALGAISLSLTRWCLLVRCQGIELTMLEAHRLGAICFLLNFVAAGSVGGDLFKAIFLAKRRPGKRVEAFASVVVDRGVGLYGLLVIATIAFLVHGGGSSALGGDARMQQLQYLSAAFLGLGTVVLVILVFGGRAVDRVVTRSAGLPVVGGVITRIGQPLRMFHDHPVAFAISILMSVGVHALLTVSIYLIAKSLYPSVPSFAEHCIIVPAGMLASALPLTPAGIGLLEAAIEWLYQVIPAQPTLASGTLVALVFELVKLIIAIVGTVFYWTANQEVIDSLEGDEPSTRESLPDSRQDRDAFAAG